jgi:thiol:disulfide interchange protein DsbD
MKVQNPTGIAYGIRAVLMSLAVIAAIGRAAAEAPGSLRHPPTPQTEEEKPVRLVTLLVLEDRPSEVTVGFHVELAPGWYLYWLNPGDAGLAPVVRWQFPTGFEAGRLRFPTPQKIVHGDIVTYGFMDETLILCDIRRPAITSGVDRQIITAVLDWMACKESCITGETAVHVNPSGLSSVDVQKSKSIFSRYSARYPKPVRSAELTTNEARLIKPPGRWTVEVALAGREAARVSDFYPYPLEDFVIDHRRITINGGKLTIPIESSNPSATLSQISGLLIINGSGFEISIPVKE